MGEEAGLWTLNALYVYMTSCRPCQHLTVDLEPAHCLPLIVFIATLICYLFKGLPSSPSMENILFTIFLISWLVSFHCSDLGTLFYFSWSTPWECVHLFCFFLCCSLFLKCLLFPFGFRSLCMKLPNQAHRSTFLGQEVCLLLFLHFFFIWTFVAVSKFRKALARY